MALPFQRTTEVAIKFVPVMVSVKSFVFTDAEVGLMLVIVGTGLFTTWLIGLDVLPLRFVSPLKDAVIEYVPTVSAEVLRVARPLETPTGEPSVAPSA